jgi:hypothetical protein
VSGTLASDTLHIGPLSPSLTFGLATNVSSEFSSYPMDGILGIGRGTGSDSTSQLLSTLSDTKLIPSKLYAIHLSRATDGLSDGELNLGSLNPDRFTGDINYIDIVANTNGFWEIPLSGASLDSNTISLSGGRSVIIDTGTSFILTPPADALALHSNIKGYVQDGETFSVPCDTTSIISFTFGQQTYNISTPDWRGGKLASGLCRSNIIGRQTFGDKQWLVGDVFLKNVYSVFDFDKGRVGFGVKGKEVGTQSTSVVASKTVSAAQAGKTSVGLGVGGAAVPTQGAAVGQGEAQKSAAMRRDVGVFGVAVAGFLMCILG